MLGLSYYFGPSNFYSALPSYDSFLFSGFYLGGAMGGFFADDKRQNNAVGHEPALLETLIPISSSPHVTNKGFEGALFLGYGWQWSRFFLGAELFGDARARSVLKRTDSNSIVTPATEENIAKYSNFSISRPGRYRFASRFVLNSPHFVIWSCRHLCC